MAPVRRPSRRRFLAGVALVGIGGTGLSLRSAARGPILWDHPPEFLTDASVFYDRLRAKRFDPLFWWTRVTRPGAIPPPYKADGPLQLVIDGAVTRPLSIAQDDLLARHAAGGSVTLLKTMQCSGDGPFRRLASNGVWTGLPLRALIAEAGPTPQAVKLRIHADDGFTANLRLSDLLTGDGRPALLAFELNGAPLTGERGGPYRLLIPDKFGFKNVKWPTRLELVTDEQPWGNHEVVINAGTDDGTRSLGAKILSPNIHQRRREVHTDLRPRRLHGVAFGGRSPVKSVELSVNRGPWQPARMPQPAELQDDPLVRKAFEQRGSRWPMQDVWTPWSFDWTPPESGTFQVHVRVTNDSGDESMEVDGNDIDADSSMPSMIIHVA